MLRVGQQIERYRILSVLGEGGMALVYLVEHETLGTRHALKVLTLQNRDVQRRMVQEGKLQATLRHPNIVAVTDVLDIDGKPGLLMEYVEGPPLDLWLHSYRPSLEEGLEVFRGVLAGVQAAHDHGLVHRDLKPANILLQTTRNGLVPKVTDFGLAKALEPQKGHNKTRTGATMGTPAYMAPEQIRDSSSVDFRADVYSLGCILYELVCGRPPYQGGDLLTLFQAVAQGNYPPPESLVPSLPESVREAIRRALAGDIGLRTPSCDSFAQSLYLEAGPPPGGAARQLSDAAFKSAVSLAAQPRNRSEPTISASHIDEDEPVDTWRGTDNAPAVSVAKTRPKSIEALPSISTGRAKSTYVVAGGAALVATGVAGLTAVLAVAVALTLWWNSGSEAPPAVAKAPDAPVTVAEVPPRPKVVAPTNVTSGSSTPPGAAALPPPKPALKSEKPDAARTNAKREATPPADKPATVAASAATPEPASVRSFSFTGAHQVVLQSKESRTMYTSGSPIPAGTFEVLASFTTGEPPRGAATITVGPSEPIRITCVESSAKCKRAPN